MYDLFRKLITMKVPQFPPWTRADKNDIDRSLRIMTDQQEAVKAQKVADAEAKQREIQMQQAAQLAGLSSSKTPGDVGPKKLLTGAKEKGAAIPWFQQQNVGSQVGGSQVKARNTSGSDVDSTSSVAQKKRAAVSFSFGKSQPNKKQKPAAAGSVVTTVFKDTQEDNNQTDKSSGAAAATVIQSKDPVSVLSFDDLLKSSLKDTTTQEDGIKPDLSQKVETDEINPSANNDELSLYVTSLGRMVTVQEVMDDPDLETQMTDEEYEKFASLQEIYEEHHMK